MTEETSKPTPKPKQSRWDLKVDSIETAERKIKTFFWWILGIAALQAVGIVVLKKVAPEMEADFFDPIFAALAAWTIFKHKSRFVAILFLTFASCVGILTLSAKLGLPLTGFGGKNISLAALQIYMAVMAVKATFYIARQRNLKIDWKSLFLSYFVLFGYVTLYSVHFFIYAAYREEANTGFSDEAFGALWIAPCLLMFWLKEMKWLPGTIRLQDKAVFAQPSPESAQA